MAIDLNAQEPKPEHRTCVICFKRRGVMKGELIHWPSADYKGERVYLGGNLYQEPFSIWLYTCQWCRGAETRRKNNVDKDPLHQKSG